MIYKEKIDELASKIPKKIIDLSVERTRGRKPTQVSSNFLINKEQGDWAENIVLENTSKIIPDYKVVKYGKSDDVMAGDPSFSAFYDSYQNELDTIGKRPDLLIFDSASKCEHNDISGFSIDEHADIVPNALMGWEVRSSSYLTEEYKPGKTSTRNFLSFTVKLEDVKIVLKWIETYGTPHYYVQVFFDAVYIISFHQILKIFSDETNYKKVFFIEKNQKNQMKTTYHIDIACGKKLGKIDHLPNVVGVRKKLAAGRLLHFIKFDGGNLKIDNTMLNKIIEESRKDSQD